MRCMTAFQDAYREVAARHDCVLVDGQALFHAIGPHGLLDEHLFMDAMHPSLEGQVALHRESLMRSGARGVRVAEGGLAPRIDIAACAAHFGLKRTIGS